MKVITVSEILIGGVGDLPTPPIPYVNNMGRTQMITIINGKGGVQIVEVLTCLGYARTANVITDHVDNEDKMTP